MACFGIGAEALPSQQKRNVSFVPAYWARGRSLWHLQRCEERPRGNTAPSTSCWRIHSVECGGQQGCRPQHSANFQPPTHPPVPSSNGPQVFQNTLIFPRISMTLKNQRMPNHTNFCCVCFSCFCLIVWLFFFQNGQPWKTGCTSWERTLFKLQGPTL